LSPLYPQTLNIGMGTDSINILFKTHKILCNLETQIRLI